MLPDSIENTEGETESNNSTNNAMQGRGEKRRV
jgi:hypothetical protein